MPSQTQGQLLHQADLERRSKELDAREAYLKERERILESGPLKLKVLEETIRVKEAQLEAFKLSLEDAERGWNKRFNMFKEAEKEKKAEIEKLERDERDWTNKLKWTDDALVSRKGELGKLNAEIREREKYQAEQERAIDMSIDEGNAAIRGVHYEIEAAQKKRDEIKGEIARLDKRNVEAKLALSQTLVDYAEREEKAKATSKAVEADILKRQEELGRIVAQRQEHERVIEVKTKQLDAKEQGLLAKQEQIWREKAELEQEQRRWHSKKSLYGEMI